MDNSLINDLLNKGWQGTTGLHLESTDIDELSVHDDLCVATVVFTGKIQGSLTIAMSEAMARNIAGKMFDYSIDSVTYDDIKDSIGELANVLAGNLKTDFFESSELSKPVVMQGTDCILSAFKIDAIFQKVFLSDNKEQLVIQVCQVG